MKRSFLLGYISGVTFYSVNSLWIFHIYKVVELKIAGVAAVMAMGLYLGLYVGVFSIFAATVGKLVLPPLEQIRPKTKEKRLHSQKTSK